MAELENSKDLISVFWSGADILRSKMDANEYKDYLLGIVFYKYLSDSFLIKVYDLLNTVNMMLQSMDRRRKKRRKELKNRDPKQQETIRKAKELLMTRNNMSEEEAHRYLQKSSMDSGTNMVETAEMVLSIMAE